MIDEEQERKAARAFIRRWQEQNENCTLCVLSDVGRAFYKILDRGVACIRGIPIGAVYGSYAGRYGGPQAMVWGAVVGAGLGCAAGVVSREVFKQPFPGP